jgi:hypothetical protein
MSGRTIIRLVLLLLIASAPAMAAESALDVKTAGNISYVSGGVGLSEREELAQLKGTYNLQLMFAYAKSGEYLADVAVKIADSAGRSLLEAVSSGPYFYAQLPPGRYQVSATNAGKAQTKTVSVPARGAVPVAFYWEDK